MNDKCGIICEYNPFHNGHAHHIQKTREYLNSLSSTKINGDGNRINSGNHSHIVCVMSGDFVQRAEPAVFDKRVRAAAAVRAGADAVIELPAVYATAGGEQFARGAVQILSQIQGMRYLSFGAETDRPELLEVIADIQLKESALFKTVLKESLRSGENYPVAITKATIAEFENLSCKNKKQNPLISFSDPSTTISGNIKNLISQILKAPNNVLGIEYLKAIKRKKLNIKPIYIKRTDRGYNSPELIPPFASASAIRTLIAAGKQYIKFTPYDYGKNIVDFDLFDAIVRTALLTKYPPPSDLALSADIFDRLKKAAVKHSKLDNIIMSEKSKNYTYAALKRFCLQIMCDITCEILDYDGEIPAKLLYMKKTFKPHLKDLDANILITFADEKRLLANCASSLTSSKIYNLDKKASDLYSVITRQKSSRHFDRFYE